MQDLTENNDISSEMQRIEEILTKGVDAPSAPPSDVPPPGPVKIPYNRVPYLNDDITFKDREAELTLLIQLLNFRRDQAIRELNYVQNCRDQQYYPGVIHQDPEISG